MSIGQEGSIWQLHYISMDQDDLTDREDTYKLLDEISFSVWSNYTNKGYRFWLDINKAEEFAQFIDAVNNHMLENGEPI